MKRWLVCAAVLLSALGVGCAGPHPTGAPSPRAGEGVAVSDNTPAAGEGEQVPAAPASAAAGEEQSESVPDVAAAILARLEGMSPTEAAGVKDGWEIPGWAVYCAGSAEVPEEAVLACQWGKGYNVMHDGRTLFWREDGLWRSQPYPPEGLEGVGNFHGLQREGDLLQVVMNVGGGQTRFVAQVGLLVHEDGEWRAVWGPQPPAPDTVVATVFLPSQGIDRYTRFVGVDGASVREDWEREGSRYVLRDRIELTPAESVVAGFVQVLLMEPEAARWRSATADALETALELELPSRLSEGFTVRSVGDGEVLLEAVDAAGAWRVTVVEADGRTMVTAIRPA